MAKIRAWRDAHSTSANILSLQYKATLGQHLIVPPGFNASVGKELALGTQTIFDFSTFQEGEVRFDPWDDSRMRLRGSEVPEFSGEEGYSGAYRLNVLVQHHGLASFLTTAVTVCDVIDSMWDHFALAPEAHAGKLPVYQIEAPFAWQSKQYPGTRYKPVYSLIGWVVREPSAFGRRLIEAPKPLQMTTTEALAAPANDALFNSATPQHSEAQPQKGQKKASTKPQKDDTLNDVVPF